MSAFATPVRGLRAGLIALLAVLALTVSRLSPPDPRGEGTPPSAFSSERAAQALVRVLGDGAPHPLGSPANAAVRERLLVELRALGFSPEVQAAFACSEWGVCAEVKNVLARRGAEAGPLVLLMAHYDSVAAGPGAGDDGAGVATLLETARALARDAPPRHPVVLLFSDGEEAGLLGAQAFVESHPLARELGVVVNVEARGTAGPSLLFETSGPENAWLVHAAARCLARPVTSSLFAAIYDRLPNDTDLTIFKRRGVPGLNFAFVGEPRRYHTPLDDLAHLDRGSLQHHGDNVLALARELSQAEWPKAPAGRVVFFDLLGYRILSFPESLTPWLALLATSGLLLLALLRRAEGRARALFWGALGLLIAVGVAGALQYALVRLWSVTQPGARHWVAQGAGVLLASWSSGFLGASLAALVVRRHGPAALRVHGAWLAWAVLALAVARLLPGAAFVPLVPALVALVALSLAPRRGLALLPTVAAGVLLFPLAWFLYDAMGLALTPAAAMLVALVAYGLAPFVTATTSPLRLLSWPLAGVAAGALLVALRPPDSAERPQSLPIVFVEDAGARSARLVAVPESGVLPDGLRAAAPFGTRLEPALPWSRGARAFAAPVDRAALPGPTLEVLSDRVEGGRRLLRLRALSPRRASALILALPAAAPLESVALAGRRLPELGERARRRMGDWRVLECASLPALGLELELALARPEPLELIVADRSPGLPPAARALADRRPATAVTIQTGDVTLVFRRVTLPSP